MIDRGSIRQAIDRCGNIWASLPGAGYGQFEHKGGSLIAKFKEAAERSERLIYEQVTAIISALVICIIVCLSRVFVDTVITPCLQSPARQKCRRTEAGEHDGTDMQMRQRDVAALDAKYTKELADTVLEMMLCVMMLPLVVVGCTSKQSVSQCVKPPPPPAWIMQPPRLADTAERDYFTPQERLITMPKTTGRTQKYINRQCR